MTEKVHKTFLVRGSEIAHGTGKTSVSQIVDYNRVEQHVDASVCLFSINIRMADGATMENSSKPH